MTAVLLREKPQSAFRQAQSLQELLEARDDSIYWPGDSPLPTGYLRDLGSQPCIYKLVNACFTPGGFLAPTDPESDDRDAELPAGITGKGRALLTTGTLEVFAESFTMGRRAHRAMRFGSEGWKVRLPVEMLRDDSPSFFIESVCSHFGHVLTDMVGRLWPLDSKDLALVFRGMKAVGVSVPERSGSEPHDLTDWSTGLLDAIGLSPRQVRVVRRPTVFSELYVPSRVAPFLSISGPRYDRMMVRAGDHLAFGLADGLDRRLFLSRSRLSTGFRSAGADAEQRLDSIFERRGFRIFHPQEHPIREQISAVRGADMIAGLAGSQLHLAVFSRRPVRMLRIAPSYFPGPVDSKILAEKRGNLTHIFLDRVLPEGKKMHRIAWAITESEMATIAQSIDLWIEESQRQIDRVNEDCGDERPNGEQYLDVAPRWPENETDR
ncbi:MAG: glycosyltransferase family 61 protein [Rhodobacterales bacterium]|nr:glycosyltransferase family 61 protein [Rhodobacterales bacterium]